jgi:hypothetical protein
MSSASLKTEGSRSRPIDVRVGPLQAVLVQRAKVARVHPADIAGLVVGFR